MVRHYPVRIALSVVVWIAATVGQTAGFFIDTDSYEWAKTECTIPEPVYPDLPELDLAETVMEAFSAEFIEEYTRDPLYIAPEGWYQPVYETQDLGKADYNLDIGVMGLKVQRVQRYLGSGDRKGYYRQATANLVSAFQSARGMAATGVVDKATWNAMGFTDEDWDYLGAFVQPVAITKNSDYDEIIKTFLETAYTYQGDQYLVGACGRPGEGADCSGLVLEALFAIGIYPDGLTPQQHSTIQEYNSYEMWKDPKFKDVAKADLLPGDLIFYDYPSSKARPIDHISIYVGNGRIFEAMDSPITYAGLDRTARGYTYVGAKRVIADLGSIATYNGTANTSKDNTSKDSDAVSPVITITEH